MSAAVASFSLPTTVLFGAGRINELADRVKSCDARRPLIVTDPGFAATRAFATVRDHAPQESHVFSATKSNPTDDDVRAAALAYSEHGCDSVIAVGGGSSLDVGKIVRVSAVHAEWTARQPLPKGMAKLPPFVGVPTTAGTGSEVGRSSVIAVDGTKRVLFDPALRADVVILDPALTVELPAKITAATGADALTHCIESFTSPTFQPICDAFALEGIHLVSTAIRRAVKDPPDLDARGSMLLAATMGGIAFQKDLGAAHSLAHPLSSICGVHHGLANALVLPTVMRFNAYRKPGVYARVGTAMGIHPATDDATIQAVQSLLSDVGIAPGLRAHGVTVAHLNPLADQAFADPCHQTNPVPVTREDLYHLYEQAM